MCHVRAGTSWPVPNRYRLEADCLQVRVGYDKLVGEVIRIEADKATIQVYEETGTSPTTPGCLLSLTSIYSRRHGRRPCGTNGKAPLG